MIRPKFQRRRVQAFIALSYAILFVALCPVTRAQNDALTPMGSAPGKPNGSYAISDIDTINLFNGHVNVRLPLTNASGRGQAKGQLSLTLDSPAPWQVLTYYVDGQPYHYEALSPYFSASNVHFGGYGTRAVGVGQVGPNFCDVGAFGYNFYIWNQTLTRIYLVDPDGTEHEMRDTATGGQALPFTGNCWSTSGPSRGRIFVSTDGSGATLIFDADIRDGFVVENEYPTGGGGGAWLLLKDGRRIRTNEYGPAMRDRNGNLFVEGTDNLNRVITSGSSYGPGSQCETLVPGSNYCQYFTTKGFGGAQRQVWISYDSSSRPSYVILPNGQRYHFYYNVTHDLIRIDLPTGGTIEYDYGPGIDGGGGTYPGGPNGSYIYRRVIERRTYREGHILESRQTFGRQEYLAGGYPQNLGYVEKKDYDSNSNLLSSEKHYFFGAASHSFTLLPFQYSAWKEGREYRSELYDAAGNLLRKTDTSWEQRAPVGWWTGNPDDAPQNDPRVTQTVSYLENGQSSTTTYAYDATVPYNSVTDVYNYDYNGALLRRTQTTYLKVLNGVDYTGSNIQNGSAPHLRDFPAQVSIYDGSGVERARTTFEYDNYNSDTNHAPLVDRPGISGFDSTFNTSHTTRGNVTATTHYLLTNGSVTGSISAYAQFDIAGNVVKTIDPRGCATTLDFTDRYGAPDGEARANSAPTELSSVGQSSYAFATKVTNCLNHTAYAQIDFYLGQAIDAEDLNVIVSSAYFNDPLDRPSQVIRAANGGVGVKSQTSFNYNDTDRIVTSTSDQNSYDDNLLKSQTVYDGLGRNIESRQYETASNYIAVRQVPFVVLQDGSNWLVASQASNPFRPYLGEQPVWTTSFADALGRVTKVKTPDNAVVVTSYSGASVTVTDQAGKKRKSVSDALGRLKEIYEDPNGLNYLTSYGYDTLDNLTSVNQGSQTRSFAYDSLARLTSANNPESGTTSYQYDANGNLTQKADARGVVSTYGYDALNRNQSVTYSDGTPSVYRYYDVTVNGKGRLSWVDTSGVFASVFDAYDALGRPTQYRQRFWVNGAWGDNFSVTASYDKAGHLLNEIYPSGHTSTYAYDNAGRLQSFTGNLGDGAQRTYATGITYSTFGRISREEFGTTAPLYHKTFYNVRGQMFDTRVSSVNDTWDWNRGRLIWYYSSNHVWGQSGTDNNGNVIFAEHWVPPPNATLDQAQKMIADNYSYDSLNRLSSVFETILDIAGGGTWTDQFAQAYTYDRWGNRTINGGATWGTGINNKQFAVDTNTNRLGVPNGQSGAMSYDGAGNLTTDTYTGEGSRTYDADNRMKQAWSSGQWQTYTYDGDGRRIKRMVNGTQTWQVYGLGGELLAEYAANAAPSSPQKEYGFRNGELLITADAPIGLTNLALNKATAQSSEGWGGASSRAVDGNTDGNWVNNSVTHTYYDNQAWWQVDLGSTQSVQSVELWNRTDCCGERLTNFNVILLDANQAVVSTVNVPGQGGTPTTVPISGAARYVRVQLVGTNYLSLAEVKVWGATGAQPVSWTNTAGVSVSGNSLTKTAALGWGNAGAASTQTIVSGDGYVEFTASETTTYRMLGLSSGDTNQDYTDIDFAIYPELGGGLHVYEAGVYRGSFGSYATGDVLRVAVEGGVVKYRRNGALLYTSTVAPSYPLLVDTSLYSNGSTLTSVVIGGAGGGSSSPAQIRWLVTDNLGTPRMVFDQTGSFANMSRHDYLPFGEEVPAGLRNGISGYATGDNVRQKFTSKERDNETGMDYFLARYYSPTQGRFTSADLPLADQHSQEPQSWNLYTYTRNNPLRYTDPTGRDIFDWVNSETAQRFFNKLIYNQDKTNAELAVIVQQQREFLINEANRNPDGLLYIRMGEEPIFIARDPRTLSPFYVLFYFEALNDPNTQEVRLTQEAMDNAVHLAGTSPALKGDPYHPDEVAKRNRPDYRSNPAHDPHSSSFNPRKTPEPSDAANVYQNSVRGGMGTWYGRGANGQIYRFFSDNAGGAHFSGIAPKASVPGPILRQLGF